MRWDVVIMGLATTNTIFRPETALNVAELATPFNVIPAHPRLFASAAET